MKELILLLETAKEKYIEYLKAKYKITDYNILVHFLEDQEENILYSLEQSINEMEVKRA